ncbi:hypothetical protein MRB53_005927 [Persea americana]|uniref:Uncharacterized protein n=1 Tax=Persea americana TaxID=3435 RepID=A0ACC2MEX9_PERAE|nr:hypothetical protein MRB53_005927 [Persea americana]
MDCTTTLIERVYIVGGDGTMRGAVKIVNEIRFRNLNISVTGIPKTVPKTVDNDVGIIDRSFGFHTAVETAQQAISAAHVEGESAVNGIGLVKLMGRSTGHTALHSTLSSRDCIRDNKHALIVVAEGAGQDLIPRSNSQKEEKDESGNPVFLDVGVWLKSELKHWCKLVGRVLQPVPLFYRLQKDLDFILQEEDVMSSMQSMQMLQVTLHHFEEYDII